MKIYVKRLYKDIDEFHTVFDAPLVTAIKTLTTLYNDAYNSGWRDIMLEQDFDGFPFITGKRLETDNEEHLRLLNESLLENEKMEAF